MIEFVFLARGYYQPEQILIEYAPTLHMPITSASYAEIDEIWQQKVQVAREQRTRLYDGSLFRLVSVNDFALADLRDMISTRDAMPDNTLRLTLGNTSYKEYVATRLPEFRQRHPYQELSNPLAVCSVIETSDGYILLDKRQGVDVYTGRYHVIGGFVERDRDMTEQRADLFEAICREIREETGIQQADIREQHCLGVAYDLTTPHPELCFLTKLHILQHEVLTRPPEDGELQQIHWVGSAETDIQAFILDNHGNISATGEANLLLYGAWKFGELWLEGVRSIVEQ